MLIKTLKLKNFKRFADLEINLDPENTGNLPKLVLLIGANGSGKSSIFDGFQIAKYQINKATKPVIFGKAISVKYLVKNYTNGKFEITINKEKVEEGSIKYNFYGLTVFRYIPQITKSQIGGQQVNPYKLFIEEEKDKFDQNIDILFNKLLGSLSDNNNDFAQDFIHKMQTGFVNIFGSSDTSLNFKKYESPIIGISPVRFIFAKGNSLDIDYSCLSAGEKMIFIILFDLYLNVSNLTDTIIYLDELDSHLNTSLQKNLLQEITENWIPDGCQLWTASHSLGFIEYARDYEKGVIIDLDNLDFDIPQVLIPVDKNDPNKRYLDIALGDTLLKTLMTEVESKYQDYVLTFSEGQNLDFLELARSILTPDLKIKFLDGGGKTNLSSIYKAFTNSKTRHFFIFDCDARDEFEKCNSSKNLSKAILIPKIVENVNQPNGIENLFEPSFFDFQANYYKTYTKDGKQIKELNKKLFYEFILNRNNPADFANFKPIFEQISQILEQINL